MTVYAITDGLVHETTAGKLPTRGCGISILVVGHHHHERQFFHRRLVDRFVERAGGSTAVADGGGADNPVDVPEAPGKKNAVDHRNSGPQMADHGKEPLSRSAAVNVAISSPHRSEGRAQTGANRVQDGLAECQSACLIANER